MSTLAIPPQRVRLYRALWDRWIIVLRILFDLGAGAHPVKWRAVADVLMVDKKTSQRYLAGLARNGQITMAGDGYMLTEAGMSAILENERGDFLPLEGESRGVKIPLVVEVVDSDFKELKLTPPPPKTLEGENPGENISPLALQIFEHIPELFDGSVIMFRNLPPLVSDEILLGWVAYAFDKRASLFAPVGLIYSKLKKDERPPIQYLRGYIKFLPDRFLDAIGLLEKTCPHCDEVFQRLSEYQPHVEACVMTFKPEWETEDIHAIIEPDETVDEFVIKSWRRLLDELPSLMQADMARGDAKAPFETWVKDTIPVHFSDGVLQVGARNTYAVSWLESRLQKTVEQALAGIMNRAVQVKFVVAVETEV